MDSQPGSDAGTGGTPGPGAALDGGPSVLARAFGFGRDGVWDRCAPSAALAGALEDAAGPGFSCRGASRDEQVGMLRQYAAAEAHNAAGRLGTLRAMMRDQGQPDRRDRSLAYEVAQALAVSVPTAQAMMDLAGDLSTRLPGIGDLLDDGIISYAKARVVNDVFAALSPEDAAKAEAVIVADLQGKNYGQVLKLAQQAAITIDPHSATRRREDAEREQARVHLFREESGAAGLAGRDLPTDEALAAHAAVNARAERYKVSGAFPGERLDRLRAAAYLDLLNGIAAEDRIAAGALPGTALVPDPPGDTPDAGDQGPDASPPDDNPGPGGPGPAPSPDATPDTPGAARPRLPDLILPLATLLGLAERPGEGYGLGPLDPGLCRALAAAAAAAGPRSTWCVTVTDENGIAVGHGCAKPPHTRGKPGPARAVHGNRPLAARVNLTIPASRLDDLARQNGPPGRAGWSFTRKHDP
ncbi:MAG TPA: DUF222 domain-containing protein, partial [Streptosporangiaceae bacterium]